MILLNKIIKIWNYAEEYALALTVVGLASLIVITIILRQIGIGFPWLEETGCHLLIFITFLGAGLGVKYVTHFKMSVLETSLPKAASHMLKTITNLTCSLFFISIVYYGSVHVINFQSLGTTTATLQIPFFISYLPIPFFSAVMSVRFLLASIKEAQAFHETRGNFQRAEEC